jgi:hypothetical protein
MASEDVTTKADILYSVLFVLAYVVLVIVLPIVIPADQVAVISILAGLGVVIYGIVAIWRKIDVNIAGMVSLTGAALAAFMLFSVVWAWITGTAPSILTAIVFIAVPIATILVGIFAVLHGISTGRIQAKVSVNLANSIMQYSAQFYYNKNFIGLLGFMLGTAGCVALALFVPVILWTFVALASLGFASLLVFYFVKKWYALATLMLFGLWIAFWNFMVIYALFAAPLIELPILLDPMVSIELLGISIAIWTFGGITVLWIVGVFLTWWLRQRKEERGKIVGLLLGP